MKLIAANWCDEAAAALAGLVDASMLPLFIEWIKNGTAKLWRIDGDNFVTWLVTRVELYPNGDTELVLDVIAGRECKKIVKYLMDRAKAMGIKSVRFETHHSEKLAKKFMGGLGFERAATVLRAVL